MTAAELGFGPGWAASGVLTDEAAAAFVRLAAADPGKPPRHWRWLAFRDFCEERGRLTADECRAAFALGAGEPDAALGTAVMVSVLYQPGCPADVRAAAAASDRPSVRRAAARRMG